MAAAAAMFSLHAGDMRYVVAAMLCYAARYMLDICQR